MRKHLVTRRLATDVWRAANFTRMHNVKLWQNAKTKKQKLNIVIVCGYITEVSKSRKKIALKIKVTKTSTWPTFSMWKWMRSDMRRVQKFTLTKQNKTKKKKTMKEQKEKIYGSWIWMGTYQFYIYIYIYFYLSICHAMYIYIFINNLLLALFDKKFKKFLQVHHFVNNNLCKAKNGFLFCFT